LHAVAGEGGEVDAAVKHEAGFDKEFVYQGYDTTCLIELDEAPPEEINEEALETGLKIALLLNCEILPVTQIMRKTVVDGSNTGGFQRTVLIAKDGYVETDEGRVGIDSVALEEDACRIIEKGDKKVVYRLDRLGIPLVEIATAPDIKSAEQVKEVALHIGSILRACKVKRGIGTIRQDVNVSTRGHPRVEIKGFQDPKMFVKTVDSEIGRQLKNKKGKSEVRRAKVDGTTEFMRPMPGKARMYPETDLKLLHISRERINNLKENLPKLRGEIRDELKGKGLSEEMINLVLKSGRLDAFKDLLNFTSDANLVAKMLILWPKEFAKKSGKLISQVEKLLHIDVLEEVLKSVRDKQIGLNDIQDVLMAIVSGKELGEALKSEKVDLNVVEQFVIKLVKEKPGLRVGAYMGIVMKEFRGQINGKEVMKILEKYVK